MKLLKREAILSADVFEQDDGLCVSCCPQIGIASQGRDSAEALDNLKEAVSLYLRKLPRLIWGRYLLRRNK